MSVDGAVPVVMYHSVGRRLPDWGWSAKLTVPWRAFEDQLAWLSKSGYRSASLDELYDHVSGKSTLQPRSVVLTFDDGYADNWAYVVPLLAKYGFTGTVLVISDFVDPRDIVRPNLEDVWAGRAREEELEVRGFMSWPELKSASERGVLSVQCHGVTHTWYPTGPDVIDFHHPGDRQYWLDWNAHPEQKPFYLIDPAKSRVPWGTPIYEHAKSLETARYFPDETESKAMADFVAAHGGESFFDRQDWRETMQAELARFRREHPQVGRFETEDERDARWTSELIDSKREIEERLGTNVEYLVWPGGGFAEESRKIASGMFKAFTKKAPEWVGAKNRPTDEPKTVNRRGVPSFIVGEKIAYPGGRYFVQTLDEYREVPFAQRRRQFLKLMYLIAMTVGVWPRSPAT